MRTETKRRVENKSRLVVGVCWCGGDWDGSRRRGEGEVRVSVTGLFTTTLLSLLVSTHTTEHTRMKHLF